MAVQIGYIQGITDRSPKWSLHEGSGPRFWRQSVVFPDGFETPPQVFLAFSVIDAVNEKEADFRVSCQAEFVTANSFTVSMSTWNDSRIWSLQVCWIAVDSTLIGSKIQLNTQKLHKRDAGYTLGDGKGDRIVSRAIEFDRPFTTAPIVLTGYSMLDMLNGASYEVRVDSAVNNVTMNGFDLEAKTYSNAKLWSVQLSWIALDPSLLQPQLNGEEMFSVGESSVGCFKPGYTLHMGEGSRNSEENVHFPWRFQGIPQVAVFLSSFNIFLAPTPDNNDSDDEEEDEIIKNSTLDVRVAVSAEQKNQFGFNFRHSTWKDSRLWSASSTWIAVGDPMRQRVEAEEYSDDDDEEIYHEEEEEEEDNYDDEEAEEHRPPPALAVLHAPALAKKAISGLKKADSIKFIVPDGAVVQATKKKKLANGEAAITQADLVLAPAAEEKDEEEIDEAKECKVCFDEKINTVMIPCGHMALCFDCSKLVTGPKGNKKCPICNTPIAQVVKTFVS